MQHEITFEHAIDPSIKATFRRPTRDEFGEYWNAMVKHNGVRTYSADHALTLACRVSPSAEELRDLVDAEWSGLPPVAGLSLFLLAGYCAAGDVPSKATAERVDLRAVAGDIAHIDDADKANAVKRAEHHRAKMLEAGITESQIAQWGAMRNVSLVRVCLALPWGGYYVGRVPTPGERASASRTHNRSTVDDAGPYAAKCEIAVGCAVFPAQSLVDHMITTYPGAGAAIGAEVESLGGGFKAAMAK